MDESNLELSSKPITLGKDFAAGSPRFVPWLCRCRDRERGRERERERDIYIYVYAYIYIHIHIPYIL